MALALAPADAEWHGSARASVAHGGALLACGLGGGEAGDPSTFRPSSWTLLAVDCALSAASPSAVDAYRRGQAMNVSVAYEVAASAFGLPLARAGTAHVPLERSQVLRIVHAGGGGSVGGAVGGPEGGRGVGRPASPASAANGADVECGGLSAAALVARRASAQINATIGALLFMLAEAGLES